MVSIRLAILISLVLAAASATASPHEVSYGGRLTSADGSPTPGPVKLQLAFHRAPTGDAPAGIPALVFDDVAVAQGAFQVTLALSAADFHTLFPGDADTWIEVKDVTHDRTYPRQRFNAVPYALKVPVDGATISYNAQGELTYVAPTPVASGTTGGELSAADWTTFNGKVSKSGDTMSGPLAMGGQKVTGLGVPADTGDAATKGYADANVGGFVLDQTGKANDLVIKWSQGLGKWYLAADQLGTPGSGMTSLNGINLSDQELTVTVGGAGLVPAWASAADTHELKIPLAAAAGVTAGLVSRADHDAFSAKQAAITGATNLTLNRVTANTDVELKDDDGTLVSLKALDATPSAYTLTLPVDDGTPGQVLKSDGTGLLGWVDANAHTHAGVYAPSAHSHGDADLTALDASKLTGTVADARFSAYGDLTAETKIGTGAAQVAAGDHVHADGTTSVAGFLSAADKTKLDGVATGADDVSAASVAGAGAVMDTDYTGNGILARNGAAGTYSLVTNNSTNWDSAYTVTNAAASANTADTLVKRNGSGDFTAGTITLQGGSPASGKVLVSDAAGVGSWQAQGLTYLIRTLVGGRLTLTSGTPITTADVTAATSVYFTPHTSDLASVYTGSEWKLMPFTELTLALGTLTSGKNYDVFLFDNAGTLALELGTAWTNNSTRATALTTQNGVLVKSGDATRRYLGTFRTTSTTATEDSMRKRFLWNYYNRTERFLECEETTASWTWTTASTFRQANANALNQVELVVGVSSVAYLDLALAGRGSTSSGNSAVICIGEDSTTACGHNLSSSTNSAAATKMHATMRKYPTIGYHVYTFLEWGNPGLTYYGSSTGSGIMGNIGG